MENSDDMIIRLDRIQPEGLDLDQPVSIDWLQRVLGDDSPFAPTADGRLKLHLLRAEDVVHVRGRASVGLGARCSRCLGPVELAIDTPVEVAMFPLGSEPSPSSDGELSGDDMGVSTYADNQIDLGGIVRDEVFLTLPMNPLCTDDCSGLCSSCGKNLNEGQCQCPQTDDVDERWSAFKDIKLN